VGGDCLISRQSKLYPRFTPETNACSSVLNVIHRESRIRGLNFT
jgi:hypothetical protein